MGYYIDFEYTRRFLRPITVDDVAQNDQESNPQVGEPTDSRNSPLERKLLICKVWELSESFLSILMLSTSS